jgi:uncharacterized membrane protein YgaE (UPF0421/DUF939 family)
LLPLVVLGRAFQAHHYGLFVLQTTLGFLLLAETLAQDWNLPQVRLINASIGVGLALLVTLTMHGLRRWMFRSRRSQAPTNVEPATDKGSDVTR